ncbi:hypothetical protein ACWD1Z_15755 [Streptomyces sp. NPDC002784]
MNSAARRALVESMVGARAGARPGVALPDVSLAAAFRGLPTSFVDDLGTIRGTWRDLFKVGDNFRPATPTGPPARAASPACTRARAWWTS